MEKIFNVDGVDLKVIADEQELINQIRCFDEFEEDTFTGFEVHWDEPKLTKEEFDKNVERFIDAVKRACTEKEMKKATEDIPKKKNKTFCKNRKKVIEYYGNTNFFQEWHNTWGTYELRYSATDDKTLVLQIVSYNHTPA